MNLICFSQALFISKFKMGARHCGSTIILATWKVVIKRMGGLKSAWSKTMPYQLTAVCGGVCLTSQLLWETNIGLWSSLA
jgi:hypothetical protein